MYNSDSLLQHVVCLVETKNVLYMLTRRAVFNLGVTNKPTSKYHLINARSSAMNLLCNVLECNGVISPGKIMHSL